MGSVSDTTPQFPKIVFSELDLTSSGSKEWDRVRARVMDALLNHGFFEAVFDRASSTQRDELFGAPMEELFGVPLENKTSTWKGKYYESYIKRGSFEILFLKDPTSFDSVEVFTHLMWPQGNPNFSKTVKEVSAPLKDLELMVRKMIFEGLGVDKYYKSHVKSTGHMIRFARYEPPENQETVINMVAHSDTNVITIVYQHRVEGLEIQSLGGQWLHAQPNTFTVFAGETFMALTNGRLKPAIHRVKVTNNDTRYSFSFASHIVEGFKIDAPKELVDNEHPKLYKPFEYEAYMQYRSERMAAAQLKDALRDYCGFDA